MAFLQQFATGKIDTTWQVNSIRQQRIGNMPLLDPMHY